MFILYCTIFIAHKLLYCKILLLALKSRLLNLVVANLFIPSLSPIN